MVYVTTIDLTKLPTEFDKWIEKDLLKISTFDVATRHAQGLRSSCRRSSGHGAARTAMEAKLNYDSSKGEWKLEQDDGLRRATARRKRRWASRKS